MCAALSGSWRISRVAALRTSSHHTIRMWLFVRNRPSELIGQQRRSEESNYHKSCHHRRTHHFSSSSGSGCASAFHFRPSRIPLSKLRRKLYFFLLNPWCSCISSSHKKSVFRTWKSEANGVMATHRGFPLQTVRYIIPSFSCSALCNAYKAAQYII